MGRLILQRSGSRAGGFRFLPSRNRSVIGQARMAALAAAWLLVLPVGGTAIPAFGADTAPKASAAPSSPRMATADLWIFSGILTVPYASLKALIAVGGGLASGMTYLGTGDRELTRAVWTSSVAGTYVLTPAHLRGERPVQLIGMPPDAVPASPTRPGQNASCCHPATRETS